MRGSLWFVFTVACWGVIFFGLAVAVTRCAFADEVSVAWGPFNGGGDRGPAMIGTWQRDWYGVHLGGFERNGTPVAYAGADALFRFDRGPWYSQYGVGLSLYDHQPDWIGSRAMFRLHARLGYRWRQFTAALGWSHFSNGFPLNRFVEKNGGGDFGVIALGWRW